MSDEHRHACPWPDCRCTHDEPCVAGWLDLTPDSTGRERVAACPNCRPDIAAHLTAARRRGTDPDAQAAARAQIRGLPRAARAKPGGW